MQEELILKNIARHINLDKKEASHFLSFLKLQQVAKKALLLQEGQVCRHIYFVCSGTLRAFYLGNDARESTIMFAVTDWWVTDMYCFVNQRAAMLNIEAVEKSTVLCLQKTDLDKLYTNIPAFERLFRILMQNAYTREQLRMIENLSLSAEERYDHFTEKYPRVCKQVPQKHIASYLGITPQFLSTLRKNKSGRRIN